jgi:hypothetical protein
MSRLDLEHVLQSQQAEIPSSCSENYNGFSLRVIFSKDVFLVIAGCC